MTPPLLRREVILDAQSRGLSQADLAREQGISPQTVCYAAKRHGVTLPRTAKVRVRPTTTERPCLSCGTPFPSEGIHNRLCDPCRQRGSVRSYAGPSL